MFQTDTPAGPQCPWACLSNTRGPQLSWDSCIQSPELRPACPPTNSVPPHTANKLVHPQPTLPQLWGLEIEIKGEMTE